MHPREVRIRDSGPAGASPRSEDLSRLGLDPGASWWVFTGIAVVSGGTALLLFRWE